MNLQIHYLISTLIITATHCQSTSTASTASTSLSTPSLSASSSPSAAASSPVSSASSPASAESAVRPVQSDLTILLTDKPFKDVQKGKNFKNGVAANEDCPEGEAGKYKSHQRVVKGVQGSRFTGIRETAISDALSEYKLLHHGHLHHHEEPENLRQTNSASRANSKGQQRNIWNSKFQDTAKYRDTESPMNRFTRNHHQLRQYGSSLRKQFNNLRKEQSRLNGNNRRKQQQQQQQQQQKRKRLNHGANDDDDEAEAEEDEEEAAAPPKKKRKVTKQISGKKSKSNNKRGYKSYNQIRNGSNGRAKSPGKPNGQKRSKNSSKKDKVHIILLT